VIMEIKLDALLVVSLIPVILVLDLLLSALMLFLFVEII
jgi:hypothetical protein